MLNFKGAENNSSSNIKLWLIISFIFLFEIFSFFGFLLPDFRNAAFFIIVFFVLAISVAKLEYGVWILLTELFIGSKGYLFYYELDGFKISIRIVLWLIVVGVWIAHVIKLYENHHRIPGVFKKKLSIKFLTSNKKQNKSRFSDSLNFFKSKFFPYYLALFIFILWGAINGFLNKNSFNNIFFDINGWLYFLLIFPIYSALFTKKEKGNNKNILILYKIFWASIIWLSVKTFFLLFIFSHNLTSIISEVYKWVRVTGVGEITKMDDSFYRIFFQSHIYVLIGFFTLLALTISQKPRILNFKLLAAICSLLSVILISFSRSFWVGLMFGLFLFYCFILWQYGCKKLMRAIGLLFLIFIISSSIIFGIVKFPYPDPFGNFNAAQIFSERATTISGEAAISSRWALLPKLNEQILKNPFLGQGFGTTVTYITSDPRVLESNATGEYTAYAFEWGWLDILLKIGLFGLLAYLFLIGKILKSCFQYLKNSENTSQKNMILGLLIGLAVLSCVNIFTPYLNHPLGIGYLILVSVIVDRPLMVNKNRSHPLPRRKEAGEGRGGGKNRISGKFSDKIM